MYRKIKKIFNLENYLLFLVVSLPLYFWRINFFGLPSNLWEAMAILAMVLGFIRGQKEKYVLAIGKKEKICFFLFSLIILGLILGMVRAGSYKSSLGIIKSWFIIPFIFAYLSVKIAKKSEKIFRSIYLSAFIIALVSLWAKFSGAVTYDGRLEFPFNSPNYLAMYLAPGLVIGMAAIIFDPRPLLSRSKIKIETFCVSFVLIFGAFYFTFSYAAWLAIFFSVFFILFLSGRLSRKNMLVLALIIFTLFFLLKDTAKFNDLVNLNPRSSLASRVMIWHSAEKMLSDNWLLGIGPGNFQADYLDYQKYFPPYLEWAVPHPQNLYLSFWLYGGMIGFLAFGAMLVFWFREALSKSDGKAIIMALGIMIYIVIHGLFDATYFKNDLAVIFWLVYFSAI